MNRTSDRVRAHLLDSAQVKQQMVETCAESIVAAANLIAESFRSGGKVLLCGNGGSAADCQHMAAEFVGRLTTDFERPGLPAVALTTDTSFLTAFANDYGFEAVFERQVQALGRPGDVLIGISTSGSSINVIRAVEATQAADMGTIVLTGTGGRLAGIADVAISVPSANSQHIQEAHLAVEHILCDLVERDLFGAEDLQDPKDGHTSAVQERRRLPFDPELIVCDFDGVFTDNRVHVDENSIESVVCNRSDGLAVDFLRDRIPLVILSTETNKVVTRRADKLRAEVRHGLSDKKKALADLCNRRNIELERVVFIGNDTNDLGAVEICGYSVAPADAHPRVMAEVDHVLGSRGGDGVMREFCEVFMGM